MTEKNFDELEEGAWYQLRSGVIAQCKVANSAYTYKPFQIGHAFLEKDGFWGVEDCDFDAILKIQPPEIIPVKRMKKVTMYVNITKGTQCSFYSGLYDCENKAKLNAESNTVATAVPVTFEIEVE